MRYNAYADCIPLSSTSDGDADISAACEVIRRYGEWSKSLQNCETANGVGRESIVVPTRSRSDSGGTKIGYIRDL